MNETEARVLLRNVLATFRALSYAELKARLDRPETHEVRSEAGVPYQVEIQVFWDSKPGGDLRVLGSIDNGGLRAFKPLTEDFLLGPDGSFVGE